MPIDKELKKKVTKDWEKSFPYLSPYTGNSLYKVVGPVLMGLELIKLPMSDEYRPHFLIYPLWKKSVKACFDASLVLKSFRNSRGFQWDVPYQEHDVLFDEALSDVREQIPLSLDSTIALTELICVLDDTAKQPPFVAAPDSYFQAQLQQAKLELLLLTNSGNRIKELMTHIKEKKWNTNHFAACGFMVEGWLHLLDETAANPALLFDELKLNLQDKKISKLPYDELSS